MLLCGLPIECQTCVLVPFILWFLLDISLSVWQLFISNELSGVAGVLFLCLVEVGLTHILMNFNDKQHRGARRILTREFLLGLRQAAPKLDLSTRHHIASLGCAGRRRGCRQAARKRNTNNKQEFQLLLAAVGLFYVQQLLKFASEY